MRLTAVILICFFCSQKINAQKEVYSLFMLKKEKKALKWVQKSPNQEIELAGLFEKWEKDNYRFSNASCQLDKLKVHPFVLASFYGQQTVIDYYLSKKEITDNTELLAAAFASSIHNNDINLINKFVAVGASKNGFCPICKQANTLQLALNNDCSDEIVDLFYRNATKQNLLYLDCENGDVLMSAATYPNPKYFKGIIDKYPSILSRTDVYGGSALSYAILNGNIENVNYLLNKLTSKEIEMLHDEMWDKSKENFLSLAVWSENSKMIDLILDKELGYPTTSDANDLENNVEIEYFEDFFTWQYGLKILLKTDKQKILQDGFLKEQLKYPLLPQQIEFIQKYLRKKVRKVKLNDELTELFSLLEEDYENVMQLRYSNRIYETNIIDFGNGHYRFETLLRDVSFAYPNLYQLNLNTSSVLLESFDKNIKYLDNVLFVKIHEYDNDSLVVLPSSFCRVERLIIDSNKGVVFRFSDNDEKDIKLTEIYITGATIENVPEGVDVIRE